MNVLYRELKQYIHNELGLTKEDIKEMIRDCIKEEIQAVLNDPNNYNKFLGNQINQYLIKNGKEYEEPFYKTFTPKCLDQVVYDAVVKELNKTIKEKVVISLKDMMD